MNLNINNNCQSPSFNAKKISIEPFSSKTKAILGAGVGVGAIANAVNQDKGMSPEELSGRNQVMSNPINPNPEVFNQEVSFNYFANGKLKNVPEYIEKGGKCISELSDYEKKGKLNTLKFQERIVDKILSEDALINNESIRTGLFYMVNYDYDFYIPDTEEENQQWMNYFKNETQARIKVMDAYAKDEKMQKNEYINKNICSLLRVTNDKQAEMIIELLKNNVDNNDEQFFDSLNDLQRNNINPDLVRKVLSDKRLYDKLDSFVLYNIDGTNEEVAKQVIQVLDDYLTNYTDSELVTEKIRKVLWDSFAYKKPEKPVEFAAKMMQDMVAKEKATKSENVYQFCERIASELECIVKGEYDDPNKTDIENINSNIERIRTIRTEIKDNIGKYTDAGSTEDNNRREDRILAEIKDIIAKHPDEDPQEFFRSVDKRAEEKLEQFRIELKNLPGFNEPDGYAKEIENRREEKLETQRAELKELTDQYCPDAYDKEVTKRLEEKLETQRAELKELTDIHLKADSKEALKRILDTTVEYLNLLKHAREQLGWGIIGFGEATDEQVNNEIYEVLKVKID